MPPPAANTFRIRRIAVGENAGAWLGALAGFDPATASVLKRDGGTAVYRTTLLRREVVLKCWKLRTLGDRMKALAGMSRADRHWHGARWLLDAGLETAEPLALISERREGTRRLWLAMAALPGKSVLQHLADRDLAARQEHAAARELARIAQTMIAAGRWNRDFKPSNLMVTHIEEASIRIATIDCVAIRRTRNRNGAPALRMSASLFLEPSGVGHPPRAALACRFLTSAVDISLALRGVPNLVIGNVRATKVWKSSWALARELVLRHGDPTPRVDPLESASRSPGP